jgi:hypothetical protein
MGRDMGRDEKLRHLGVFGGNGSQSHRPMSGVNVPIVGQSKVAAKLAGISYIQSLVVGHCTCGGDVVIPNFTAPGVCSKCRVRYWINVIGFNRDTDPEAFNIQIGREAPADEDEGKGGDDGAATTRT